MLTMKKTPKWLSYVIPVLLGLVAAGVLIYIIVAGI